MNYKIVLLLIHLPLFVYAQKAPDIIPQPVSMQTRPGTFFLTPSTSLKFDENSIELLAAVDLFKNHLYRISGYQLKINTPSSSSIELAFETIPEVGDEGYLLSVTPSLIRIRANTKTGIVYGIQTVMQTLPAIRTNADLLIPCMEIKDYPRFSWRGMHLDVSRHFFSPEFIKEYIDLIAGYKMNKFHWHLVDDQGWRIEIKKYPELTKTGAWRVDHTDKVWANRPQATAEEKATYGGYYSQDQIKEIVRYAMERNVTIVPEIEMPGHVASAIASYPQLSCSQHQQLPLTGGDYTGISSNYCAGNDSVFVFLQDVLSEVIELFPSSYIHIGGDEVDKTPWHNCSRCQLRMKSEGLKNEEELQSYFIGRIEKFLIGKNRKMIGWDEILEGGLAPEATVMSWRGEAGGIQAAKMGHEVVMTPGSPVYFDHYQAGPAGEPLAIGGMNTLRKVYMYEPIPAELNSDEEKFVLGAQANVWTEYITTAEHAEYMVLPRMLALSEVVWSPVQARNWENFNFRLLSHFKAFEQTGKHFSPGNYTIEIKPVSENGKVFVGLDTDILYGEIHYTTDGSMPTIESLKYTDPVPVESSVTIQAVTVLNGKVMGLVPAKQSFELHKGIGASVLYTNPVSRYYQADGPNSLSDGIRGTESIKKNWHGFSGKDMIATVDLGKETSLSSLSVGFLQRYKDWIFLPSSLKIEISNDGKKYTLVETIENTISINDRDVRIENFTSTLKERRIRFVRLTATNNVCPPGHPGEGKPAWIFVDEIIIH